MTVFKTYLKIFNKYKIPLILFTVMLVLTNGINFSNNKDSLVFEESKPDILIINNDEEKGVTKNLIDYIKENSNEIKIEDDEDAINDALFYRDINYIIYIPKNYRQDFMNNKNPEIEIKSTKDHHSYYSEMLLSRYIKVANIYNTKSNNEDEIIKNINKTLDKDATINIESKLDTNSLNKASFYYNFLNYSLLAGSVYIICMILSTFKEQKINKRTVISSMDYKKHNRILMLSNCLLAFFLWLIYIILSLILIGKPMLSSHGLIYIINSFIFNICAVSIGFLIGNLVNNKEVISGIINVVGLGSSFLCGAFVPLFWLPDIVIKVAHLIPSYWFIKSNELIKNIEIINIESLKPIISNMLIICIFTIIFIIITNIITKKKQKFN